MIVTTPRTGPRRSRRRRGFGLIELTITAILAVTAMTVTVQLVGWVAAERRAALRRERALLEAGNLLERLAARPWEVLGTDPAHPPAVSLPESTRAVLPGASVAVEVHAVEGPVASKRVAVVIRWRDGTGTFEAPVRLVTWVYPQPAEGAKP